MRSTEEVTVFRYEIHDPVETLSWQVSTLLLEATYVRTYYKEIVKKSITELFKSILFFI